jgi:hypothetical protein
MGQVLAQAPAFSRGCCQPKDQAGSYDYIGFGGAVDSAYYRQGTLSVDLVDVRRNALVWQGVAEGRVDTPAANDPGSAIEAAITEIFAGFPDGKGK